MASARAFSHDQDPEPTYSAETVAFVQQQYDLIRSDRAQITPWFAT